MSGQGIGQIIFYAVVLTLLAVPLGRYMAWIYNRERDDVVERAFFRLSGRDSGGTGLGPTQDCAHLQRPLLGVLYAILRLQNHLFLNLTSCPRSRRTSR
jgi:K+-transporting ATPase A subunit